MQTNNKISNPIVLLINERQDKWDMKLKASFVLDLCMNAKLHRSCFNKWILELKLF